MKDALLILPRYVLFFVIILIVLGLFSLAAGSQISGDLGSAVGSALLPATVVSVFASFYALPTSRIGRLFAFIVLTSASSLILILGSLAVSPGCAGCIRPDVVPIRSGFIERFDGGAIFAMHSDADEAQGVVSYVSAVSGLLPRDEEDSADLSVRYVPWAEVASGERLISRGTDGDVVVEFEPIVAPLFAGPPFIERFSELISAQGAYLYGLREASFSRFLATAIGITAFASSCMLFARFSRWRLVSFTVTLLMVGGVFSLLRLFAGDIVRDLVAGALTPQAGQQIPALLFMLLASLLLVVDQLFGASKA